MTFTSIRNNLPPNNGGPWVLQSEQGVSCANTGAVNRISLAQFSSPGGMITGDEFPIGTLNPQYLPVTYGAVGAWQPAVSFDVWFLTQLLSPSPFVGGVVANPLTLDAGAGGGTSIQNDTARPSGQQRSIEGNLPPVAFGPIAMLFTADDFVTLKPVVGVAINVGFCNAVGTIRMRAYSTTGALLGTWLNLTFGGYEDFVINRDSNTPIIAGVLFDSNDAAGFSISRIQFSNTCA